MVASSSEVVVTQAQTKGVAIAFLPVGVGLKRPAFASRSPISFSPSAWQLAQAALSAFTRMGQLSKLVILHDRQPRAPFVPE